MLVIGNAIAPIRSIAPDRQKDLLVVLLLAYLDARNDIGTIIQEFRYEAIVGVVSGPATCRLVVRLTRTRTLIIARWIRITNELQSYPRGTRKDHRSRATC